MSEPARFFTANFYAEADAGLCQACGACEVRCQMEAIGTNDGIAYVDRSRCIGCGLCATTCPSGAMEMKLKEDVTTPAESSAGLYLRLLKDRYGATGVARLAALNLVGRKV
jgi:Fe-S-cluster-containing hydrogenase component 2